MSKIVGITQALEKLLPSRLPPSLSNNPANLYQVLSRTPLGGVGRKVHQVRWGKKGIENCWWEVTRAKFKVEGKHGKAWGRLYWNGKPVSAHEEKIRGGLKYEWTEGISQKKAPQTVTQG